MLQNMLWRDPRDRLSLADVMGHPWVVGECFPDPEVASPPMADIKQYLKCDQSAEEETAMDAPVSPTSTIVRVESPRKHGRKRSGARDSILKLILPKRFSSGPLQVGQSHEGEPKEMTRIIDT